MSNIQKILKETPLETRIKVSTEMSFISLLTELGFREERAWEPHEDELLGKLMRFAKEETKHTVDIFKKWEADGRPE